MIEQSIYSREKVFIKDIYKDYNESFWTRDYDVSNKKKGKKTKLTYMQYRLIVKTFMQVYFNELYFSGKKRMYFFLTGIIELAKSVPRIHKRKETIIKKPVSVAWIWYHRPTKHFSANVWILKMTGSTNIINKLDKKIKKLYDIGLLQDLQARVKELREKKMFVKK